MDDRTNTTSAPTKTPTEARAGVTGHNVRYVLAFGLGGVIVLFAIVWVTFFNA
jgi:hypothetical protein